MGAVKALPAVAVIVWTCVFGAPAVSEPRTEYLESERRHWSLLPRSHLEIPAFESSRDRAWARSTDAPEALLEGIEAVDAFIVAKLVENGLRPAPQADRRTLIRRLYFDLIGLPPTPTETADFVANQSPDAYPKLVERLLSDPRYGERWAQHWLDVIRFAESEGFEYDRHLPGAWRFRDYVIRSLNDDKPYDQFIREQLAGDEIDPENHELKIAAGFHRLGAVRRNAGNQEVASSRNEVLTERTDIVGAAFLGLTVGCARCHDHMFDAVRQKDYYRLQAFLAATREDNVILASEDEQAAWKKETEAVKEQIKELKDQSKALPVVERGPILAEAARLETTLPQPLPTLCSIRNSAEERTLIHVLERGNWDSKGESVGPRVLGVLLPDGAPEHNADIANPRTRLAEWVIDPENPLTARVMANRVWLYHFGQGIVRTANDFGVNGDRPSHPELLDFLANELVDSGWSLKHLHRLMVLSKTYRQDSRSPVEKEAGAKDPENRLLWRFSRRRLEAEEVRDAMLAVAGQLNTTMGGPSVMVPVEKELVDLLYKPIQWRPADDPGENNRRSVYLMAKRNLRVPFLEVFDQPPLQSSCWRRESSTHAPQALELLNGDFSNRLARSFADGLFQEVGENPREQVEQAYLLAAGREPSQQELELAMNFLADRPLSEFALAVFNLNAFLYVN